MSQVLGIDIGSYSVKVAFLNLNKLNVSLKNVIEVPIPYREQPEEKSLATIQALRECFETVNLSNLKDNVYTALGSQDTVLQTFEFAKVSLRNLDVLIQNEFDNLGLFSQEDYLVEHIVQQRTSKLTKVLGVLIKKSAARDLIAQLAGVDISCRLIDIECFAFQNIIPYVPELKVDVLTTNLIVNIGHRKTSIIIIENNQVVFERSFNLAGHYITSQIQNECGVKYEEAQELKHAVSGTLSYETEMHKKVKEILIKTCQEIGKEIERLVLGFKSSMESNSIGTILLTGGTAKILDLDKTLENLIGIKVQKLKLQNSNFTNNSPNFFLFESFSQAMAIALRGTSAKTNSHVNIRHGDLALVSDYEPIIQKIFAYIKLVIIVSFVLFGTYYLCSSLYNNRINDIKSLFKTQVISYFGSEPPPLRPMSGAANWDFEEYRLEAMRIINDTYDQKLKFIDDIYSGNEMFPLIVLNTVSAVIPKSIYFEVTDFKVQDGVLAIQADTDSKESVAKIIGLLNGVKMIKNVQKKSEAVKPGTNGKIINFALVATVNMKEGM